MAGTDYTHTEGDLVFSPNETSKAFQVPVTNNTVVDGPRTVLLHLGNPQAAQLGPQETAVLTIQDDDGGGTFKFSATGYSYPDKPGYATITVTRSGGSAGGVSVKYRTGSGTAVPGRRLHGHHHPADPDIRRERDQQDLPASTCWGTR